MKKNLLLALLPLLALGLSSCNGIPEEEPKDEDPTQEGEGGSSEGEGEGQGEGEGGGSEGGEGGGSEGGEGEGGGSEGGEGGEGGGSEGGEGGEGGGQEERTPAAHKFYLAGADVPLYEDKTFNPATDVWGGVNKFVTDPVNVTEGQTVLVVAEDNTHVWANAANASNNVNGNDPDGYTVKVTASAVTLELYVYSDGYAFNLGGYDYVPPVETPVKFNISQEDVLSGYDIFLYYWGEGGLVGWSKAIKVEGGVEVVVHKDATGMLLVATTTGIETPSWNDGSIKYKTEDIAIDGRTEYTITFVEFDGGQGGEGGEGGEQEQTDISVFVNGTPLYIGSETIPEGSSDKAIFKVSMNENDIAYVAAGTTALEFKGLNGVAFGEATTTFTAPATAEYTFYVTSTNEIWVIYAVEPVGVATVDLYAKFGITNEQTSLVAYAWVFSTATDGTWYLATYVPEEWEKDNDRHYTIQLENPLGKTVVLALFAADSGVDADHSPDASWTGKVSQSGDAPIQQNEANFFASVE